MADEMTEAEQITAPKLRLSDFCDMAELEKLLSDWTITTDMSAIVRDTEHQYITKPFGFSDYCGNILSSEAGNIACRSCEDGADLFRCHAGLCDFSLPVTLPDGQTVAYIFCGQVKLSGSEEPDFAKLAAAYRLDAGKLRADYANIQFRSTEKIEAAKALLSSTVNSFVARSYKRWIVENESQDDRTLSQITQILYAYNITLDLTTGKYTLITGTGLDRLVAVYKRNTDYITAQKEVAKFVHPGYVRRLYELVNTDHLKKCAGRSGHIDTMEYPVIYPGDDNYEWHEINVFMSHDAADRPIVNILGRDMTEAHNLQEKNTREMQAAAARNQILSDLTKMLYSYNITLNLNTGKYTLIEGTGMTEITEIFRSTDDYPTAYAQKIRYILPESAEQFAAIASLEALRSHRNSHGIIGSLEYGATADGKEVWYEINVFISADELGNPIANILGRDITEAHKRQEQREIAQKAAAARDQLLSGVTKMLYSFNITVNLNTWKYTLITGTGCDDAIAVMQASDDAVLTLNRIRNMVDDESKEAIDRLCGITAMQSYRGRSGYIGTISTSGVINGRKEWQEVNLFIGSNEFGEPIANVLGRDITESRRRQEEHENELRASAAKDQILSEITKSLYSFNITVDLKTGKYSLITGTGMDDFVAVLTAADDYETTIDYARGNVLPEYLDSYTELVSLGNLRRKSSLNGHIGQLEYAVCGKNGTEWHEANVFISSDENGDALANILGRDVTETHLAQERRENELRAVAAKDQILSEITKTLYSYNITLNLLTGKYSLILGTGMENFVKIFEATDDYETAFEQKVGYVSDEFKYAFVAFTSLSALRKRTGSKGYIGNLEYSADDGTGLEWHEINVFIGTDEYGAPIANILGRDITEAHEQLANRERELRAAAARDQLLSGITKMLYSYNMTVNVNTGKYTLITGTGLESIVDEMQHAENYSFVLDKFRRSVLPEYLEKGLEFLSLETYRGKNLQGFIGTEEFPEASENGVEWHEINIFAGYDDAGNPVINVLGRDVTEAHARADTEAKLAIAEASSKSKTQFLFNMSHDIRTPMNAIIGFTDLLQKHLDDRELAESYIGKIKYSNEFLLSLINNVLEMARIESGKETLDETVFDAREFTDSVGIVFDAQMQEKGISFTRSLQVEHTSVYCDGTKLREIFLNLLSNALKYTPPGGSVSMDTTEIPFSTEGYMLCRTVISDTGIGMSKEFLPHLFEEFSRERNSTESKVMGTGLGMPIVKSLIELMHGTIEVESELGKGTTFTVTIPHRIAETAAAADRPDQESAEEDFSFEGKHILLAEDNDLNAEIAMEILGEVGFEIDRAADGIICVDMLQKAPCGYYDVILMDIQMPNMDGYKATQVIRAMDDPGRSGIPIIAMTANAFDEDRRNALAAGMNGHLAKPIDVAVLMKTLAGIFS